MELTNQQITELKQRELELFRAFIDVCEKLGIKYYVVAGTLLGAVRHQGFIPWDDDIDIAMFRKDYDTFIQQGQQYMPRDFFIQTHDTDPDFPANFCKIRNSATTFVESSMANRRINHGVFIDIFPLDFYPEKGRLFFEIMHKLQIIRITDAFVPSRGMKKITKIIRIFTRLLYPSITAAVHAREKMISSVPPPEDNLVISNSSIYRRREIVPYSWYGDGVTLDFEGLKVTAPVRYHELLSHLYGDYMQPPPESERIPHHFVSAFDLDHSYLYSREDIPSS